MVDRGHHRLRDDADGRPRRPRTARRRGAAVPGDRDGPLEAVRHFRASAEGRDRTRRAAHYNLGTALAVAGQLDEAVKEYERAIALNPKYAVALANLGSVLLQQGRTRDAVRAAGAGGGAVNPRERRGLNSLSVAYAAEGDIEKALATIDRALKLNPSDAAPEAAARAAGPAPPQVESRDRDTKGTRSRDRSPDLAISRSRSSAHSISRAHRDLRRLSWPTRRARRVALITGSSSVPSSSGRGDTASPCRHG